MIFTQYYLECLSHASYLVGDETTGRAVVVDPQRSAGRPRFVHGGARVEEVVGRLRGGDGIEEIARDVGVPVGECLEAVRVLGRLRRVRAA